MTLLLSLESVVTNYAVPGDLFKKADFQGGDGPGDGFHGGVGPTSLRAPPSLSASTAPTSAEVSAGDTASPSTPQRCALSSENDGDKVTAVEGGIGPPALVVPPSPTAGVGGGGEMVATAPGVRQVNLDTTGDGERDLMIAFPSLKGSDEAKLKQWLGARSERANIFHAELDFIKCLTDISNGLFGIEREFRRDVLRRELEKLNSHIPKNVFIPTDKRQHRILRIVPEAAHVFSTKERVPYLMVLEVEDIGPPPPPEDAGADRRHVARDREETKRRRGRQASTNGAGPSRRISLDNPSAGVSGVSAGGGRASGLEVADEEPAPNLPDDKFEFLPEMTTTDSVTGIDVAELAGEPSSMYGALVKRISSFRVDDSEYADDRRPPDEELIKALGEPWTVKSERIRKASPFGSNPNWRLISCIVKARDQLRQEMFAQRLIQEFSHIFVKAKLPLYLKAYSIIATSSEAGLIETLYDAKSIDSIKKDTPNISTLQDYFIGRFGGRGSSGYKKAVRNFVQSMAGYSVVSYLLNIKDRHNGNLMIDAEGHIIHIDFGFLLSNSPGGNTMEFERSPFKLTREMAQVMGGPKSGAWKLFRKLSIQGYVEACRHANKIMLLVDIAYPGNERMPCFLQGRDYVLSNLRERFGVDLSRKERAARMARLIDTAHGNWTTKAYDQFQRLSLGIAK
jgi:phosphatidylinositol 4-kinase B